MPVNTASKDGILTIQIAEERLVDPDHMSRVFSDLNTALNKTSEDRVIVDLTPIRFLASAALGKFVQLNKMCSELKVKLKLCGVSKEILEVFKITKLHKVFDIAADEPTARKAFQKTGLFR